MKLDIIGDIHGCYKEFKQLTELLGYNWRDGYPVHPANRHLAFVGDLTDRGPSSLKVIDVLWKLMKNNQLFYVPGNHCNKLYRYFLGNKVQIRHGLETTVAEFQQLTILEQKEVKEKFIELYENAPLYYILDDHKLIIAHAGIREDYIGSYSNKVKSYVLYGDITGETHADGFPIRRDWAKEYQGKASIVYGHTPVKEVRIIHNTYNIDTGAVFGGKLTALRYPEMETVSVTSSMPYIDEKFRSFN
ncbi:MAG: bis(5'-nucleosyl)-tetraphosphatase PrpE [Bacillus sp. (in: firmicutes)]